VHIFHLSRFSAFETPVPRMLPESGHVPITIFVTWAVKEPVDPIALQQNDVRKALDST
jgi:hypothetical protein